MQDAIGLNNGRVPGRPPRVLVVDDDPAIRLVCATTLRREGYEAIEAANGQEGYERAIVDTPDLALLDVQMPELDGFGLAAALLGDERTQQLRLVFTGDPDPCIEALAYEAGALGFIAKPFDSQDLGSFVNRAPAHLTPGREPAAARPSA